jgi:EAL domain-containing protein (putative c-di-GMP-specific phosphodiesterase class I)/GGDEF domain-containing protein
VNEGKPISRREYLRLHRALHDRITGLPAFPLRIDAVRAMLDEQRQVGVLHVEVGNLARVESLYGWQVFDRVLAHVAEVLREAVGAELPPETLLATGGLGGDRFVAFVPHRGGGDEVDSAWLAECARGVAVRLERAFDTEGFAGLNPRLEFRTGHALLGLDPFYRFERRVVAALDEARALHERRARRRRDGLGHELRRILERGALRTWFQPVVELDGGGCVGWEALARGPEASPLEMPGTLFAISDEAGLATELDRACRAAALRDSAALEDGTLFLNALPGSFAGLDPEPTRWPDVLRQLVQGPRHVVLEFSERAAAGDGDGFRAALERLRGGGFGIAVDDLGTGFATEALLDDLRPDYLKLDTSLVRGVERSPIKQELLRTLVRIATSMGASVVAEGVETEDEAVTLRHAGARLAQGYLFARPGAPAGVSGDRGRPAPG